MRHGNFETCSIDLNAINWANPYAVKISPNPGCLVVHTTCATHHNTGNRPTYFISVRDGEREANFITNGSDHITAEDFTSGTNANGHRFFSHNNDLSEIYAQDIRKTKKVFKAEQADMIDFILNCLDIPVNFAAEGSMIYLV